MALIEAHSSTCNRISVNVPNEFWAEFKNNTTCSESKFNIRIVNQNATQRAINGSRIMPVAPKQTSIMSRLKTAEAINPMQKMLFLCRLFFLSIAISPVLFFTIALLLPPTKLLSIIKKLLSTSVSTLRKRIQSAV